MPSSLVKRMIFRIDSQSLELALHVSLSKRRRNKEAKQQSHG